MRPRFCSSCRISASSTALNDDRGLDTALNAALADMRTDGTTRAILAKYLPDPDKYLEVDYGR